MNAKTINIAFKRRRKGGGVQMHVSQQYKEIHIHAMSDMNNIHQFQDI